MKTGVINAQFDPIEDDKRTDIGKMGKTMKKVKIKGNGESIEGKDKKKKRRRQGYPNLAHAQRSKDVDDDSDVDFVDEDTGVLPVIEGFDPRKRKGVEFAEINNTRPGICDDCKRQGLKSADEYMQMTFKKYDTKDEHSKGRCIVCHALGSNFNFLDSTSGSASMTYPRDFYDKFSRETKVPNLDSEADHTLSPELPSIKEHEEPKITTDVYSTKLDPLGASSGQVLESARKGVIDRLSSESPTRNEAVGRHHSPKRESPMGYPQTDTGGKDGADRYSPNMIMPKKDKYRRELQYPDPQKKELLARQFQFESPKLDLTGPGDIHNVSKKDLSYRKDLKHSTSFEPSKYRHLLKKSEKYVNYPLPSLKPYFFAPPEITDEFDDFYHSKGLRGGTVKKDPNPLHRERQELLQKQDKYSMYSVGSLGLVYGLPEHNRSLTDRSSVSPESNSPLSFERGPPGSRPLSLLPPLKPKKRPFSYFSYG